MNKLSTQLETAFSGVAANYKGQDVDLYEIYKKMRSESPVLEGDFMGELGVPNIAGHEAGRRTFTLFKYDDVMAVLRDAETFTSGFIAAGLGAFMDGLILTGMDGELHKKMRTLLHPVFMPKVVNTWRNTKMDPIVREEFLAPLAPAGKANLMDFALHFPVRLIYSLIGFPDNEPELIKKYASWALDILAGPQVDPKNAAAAKAAAMAASESLYKAVLERVSQVRAQGEFGGDLIGRLIVAEYEGRSLDDHEIATFVRSLLPAAGETTTRTFGTAMVLLLERPELLERVTNNRELVSSLIDEAVRYEPVATFKVRQASREVEIRGVTIPEGSMVQCIVASANRDEAAFDGADQFNIDRKVKPSFGFGFGPHVCIGQFIAKTELSVAINAVLDMLPNIRFDPDYPAPVIRGAQLRGPDSLHVVWGE
ncbi:MAG: cytochrome P450 [Zhongshania aliphaticivorans]|uniref:cytochrome P450 n=1 Tax=Zhongshania aliphaticivorans TaxID=1470434 RepID=UPI0039E42674